MPPTLSIPLPNTPMVILTGAGISAESGIKTFREAGGLWENHPIEAVATPQGFANNPRLVWQFYHARREQLKTVSPNPAHHALAQLQQTLGPDDVFLVTQNVDDLHQRGGSAPQAVLHMHGELRKVRCRRCGTVTETDAPMLPDPEGPLPTCFDTACGGALRPHIVWFGEVPFGMDDIAAKLATCSMFVAIGTSGVVYPAAGFLAAAKHQGATTLGFNLEPPENAELFDYFVQGPAGQTLPDWVDTVLETLAC